MPSKAYSHSIYYLAKRQASRANRPTNWSLTESFISDTLIPSYSRRCSFTYYGPMDSALGLVALPSILAATLSYDIGVAVANLAKRIADPDERALMAAKLRRELRILRRPLYYARETERRRQLAADRRKLHRRCTTAPMPTPAAILDLWNRRKESKENMILLGGMLQDLECYVDNCLRFDADGKVVGRNGGIRGWLSECLPELSPHYKTLMRYKAMAIRLRQATETKDPKPTSALLAETPRHEVVDEILKDFRTTFSSLEETLAAHLDADLVFWTDSPPSASSGTPPHKSSTPIASPQEPSSDR